MEQWKDIKGYEGLYQVSNLGNVKSIEKLDSLGRLRKERILKPYMSPEGYLRLTLSKKDKQKKHLVHRLVAQAFLENPDNLSEVNHKNEDKSDNRVENLEFCDRRYNVNYGTGIQRKAEKQINGKCSKTVYQYTLNGEFVKEFPSTMEVERQLGYFQTNIGKCCLGKRKTAYGYKWSYNDIIN